MYLKLIQLDNILKNSVIKASCSGFIHELYSLNIGDYIIYDTEILTIIPENDEIKCVVKIPNGKIFNVKEGQKVLLQIPDLSIFEYKKIEGKIATISKDSWHEDTSFFLVDIYTEDKNIMLKNGERIPLHIGAKVYVKIILNTYTIFQLFFQELLNYEKKEISA